MSDNKCYPLLMKPVYKSKIWGGRKLESYFGKELPDGNIGESWELTDRKSEQSIVVNGVYAGKTFREVAGLLGEAMFRGGSSGEYYSLLIKLLDADDVLSVQVHPDDEYAAQYGEHGKTEMWYIVQADDGAELVYGTNDGVDAKVLERAAETGEIDSCLKHVKVHQGEVYFIPAGTVHAIGKGILICEIQQNCDTTYRVYDWGRLENGKPRELHIKQALEVTDFNAGKDEGKRTLCNGIYGELLVSCKYFNVERYCASSECSQITLNTAEVGCVTASVVAGSGKFTYVNGLVEFKAGDTVFLPAGLGECAIDSEDAVILLSTVPCNE